LCAQNLCSGWAAGLGAGGRAGGGRRGRGQAAGSWAEGQAWWPMLAGRSAFDAEEVTTATMPIRGRYAD